MEAELGVIELIDKHFDHSDRVVFCNVIVQVLRQQS